MMKELHVFDLDGVLIDSKTNMRKSWESVMHLTGVEVPFDEYFKHVGKPFDDILMSLNIDERYHKRITNIYSTHSKETISEVKPYKNVIDTLITLREHSKVAIVTSKSKDRTDLVISQFPAFDYVCSPKEGLRGKPYGDQLNYVMAKCKTTPDKTVYIGDMLVDKKCAEACSVDFIYAAWGYGEVECENQIENISQLLLV